MEIVDDVVTESNWSKEKIDKVEEYYKKFIEILNKGEVDMNSWIVIRKGKESGEVSEEKVLAERCEIKSYGALVFKNKNKVVRAFNLEEWKEVREETPTIEKRKVGLESEEEVEVKNKNKEARVKVWSLINEIKNLLDNMSEGITGDCKRKVIERSKSVKWRINELEVRVLGDVI